uniref:Ionotropic glutamate receptor L-glutamate and glycine-binding domain-containing protein n=1 Tax=Anopheles albimanus TaxID=7167 RepID=A0A182FMQ1_ANOAL
MAHCQSTWVNDASMTAIQYFKARDVKWVTVFCCWPSTERYMFAQKLNSASVSTQFLSMEKDKIDKIKVDGFSNAGLLVDATCKYLATRIWQVETVFNKLLMVNLFWLVLEDMLPKALVRQKRSLFGCSVLEDLMFSRNPNLELLPYTNFVIGYRGADNAWKLFEVFKVHYEALLMVEVIESKFISLTNNYENLRVALERVRKQNFLRRNLQGFPLSCGSAVTAPEYYKGPTDQSDAIHDLYMRANFPIINELMYDMNFTLNLVQVDSGGWKKNGSFSGLFGKFQNHSIELGCIGTLMRTE